jgi:hypothetical protein
MAENDKSKDQFGTYSENVGEWTTGTGAAAGTGKTHLHPVKKNNADSDEETAGNQSAGETDETTPGTEGGAG